MSKLCYKSSNNKEFKCPPRMDDGRHFTDYRPNCSVNSLVRENNKIMNSYEYRMFLTHNGNNLMNLNRSLSSQKNACGPCMNKYNEGTMLSEKKIQTCNDGSCNTGLVNENGIGLGRRYDNVSTECSHLTNSNVDAKPSNCCADNNNLFNYYNDMTSKAQGELVLRNSSPGGGALMSGGDPKAYNL